MRANDPAVDHTEEPMDLMFMNSIWTSATFPPQDAWLSGYAISYYYLGYLATDYTRSTGRTAARNRLQPRSSLLVWIVDHWLLWRGLQCAGQSDFRMLARRFSRMAATGGLLAVITVALAGNMLGVIEWLHANGVDMKGVGQTLALNQFVNEATSHQPVAHRRYSAVGLGLAYLACDPGRWTGWR